MDEDIKLKSTYINLLPAIFNNAKAYLPEDKSLATNDSDFISKFLLIFEQIFSGFKEKEDVKGIGEKIDKVYELFYPYSDFLNQADNNLEPYFSATVNDVLSWMANILAFEFQENWDLEKKKEVLLKILSIFRQRGTRRGLKEYLGIYLGERFVNVYDDYGPTAISINRDTRFVKLPPYFFSVHAIILTYCISNLKEQINTIKKVIDTEKPVQTDYQLIIKVPIMRIGVNSTVGLDTYLGVRPMQVGCYSTVGVNTFVWGPTNSGLCSGVNDDPWPEELKQLQIKPTCQKISDFLPEINYETWKELPMQIGVRSTIHKDARLSKKVYNNFKLYKCDNLVLCM